MAGGSVNKVILIGNLGADPEVKRTQSGMPVVNLNIATSESWRDRNSGERKERTEWHRVVIFNEGLCKVAEQYLRKGSKVYVEGQLQTRSWEDQSGQKRYSTEVVLQGFSSGLTMLDGPGGRGERGGAGGHDDGPDYGAPAERGGARGGSARGGFGGGGSSSGGPSPAGPAGGDLDDDIPF